MLMYNLTFQLPFIPGFAACSLFSLVQIPQLTVFVDLVTGISS